MKCHCGSTTSVHDGDYVYGPGYEHKRLVVCDRFPLCDSFVGTHSHSGEPLGQLADKRTRKARINVHKQLDPLWRKGLRSRTHCYKILKRLTGQEHIADMNAAEAIEAALLIKQWKISKDITC